MVNHIKSRLSSWKSRYSSFGGRLVLLKYVLTSLHVYALSFVKAPSGIISSIKSLLICFFFVRIIGKFLGLTGSPFVSTRMLVVWGLGELGSLMWRCWVDGVGDRLGIGRCRVIFWRSSYFISIDSLIFSRPNI